MGAEPGIGVPGESAAANEAALAPGAVATPAEPRSPDERPPPDPSEPAADPVVVAGVVAPTRDDNLVRWSAAGIGGPLGRYAATWRAFWTPQRALLAMLCGSFLVALLIKAPCHNAGWPERGGDAWLCYSDIPFLFRERGLWTGDIPFFDVGDYPRLEYPVLIGFVMYVSAAVARTTSELIAGSVRFFDVTALLMIVSAAVTVILMRHLAGRRPWDVAMFALAPVLILSGLINWDLLAVALATGSMLAWARQRPVLAGILLGLGVAMKLYPLLLLGPILVLCIRTRRLGDFVTTTIGAAAAWFAVNLPVMVLAREGWWEFFRFNDERSGEFGSVFYVLSRIGHPVPEHLINPLIFGVFLIACIWIAWLGLTATRRPRLAQLAFLVVAAFLLVNKVYSPQYALWLLPLAVLARPRWRDFLVWQAFEVLYWFAVWLHLAGYLAQGTAGSIYNLAVLGHVVGTLFLCVQVVRDIWDPRRDPVRRTGDDDPTFPWAETPAPAHAESSA